MSPLIQSRRRGRPKVEGLPERRREEILAVATEEFARRGYPNTDLQAVADRLGVGKGTVYRYFPTKEAIFLAAADRLMRLLNEDTDRAAGKGRDAFERINLATRAYLRFFDRHPEFVEILVQERAEFRDRKRHTYFAYRDANIGPWNDLFRDLIARGEVRQIPPERITDVISSVFFGAIFTNYFESRRRSPERQAADILDVIYQGILGPRARRNRHQKGASS